MVLYNITIGIDKAIEKEWLIWMKNEHIPQVLDTAFFVDHKLYKVISHEDEKTVSYCIQYVVSGIEQFNSYLKEHASTIEQEHGKRFKGKHVAFRTLLEEI